MPKWKLHTSHTSQRSVAAAAAVLEERVLPCAGSVEAARITHKCHKTYQRITRRASDIQKLAEIHPPQSEMATRVVQTIRNEPNVVFQTVYAPTQSGKTGGMVCITKECLLTTCTDRVFIISGVNSTEWKTQTKQRQLSPFRHHIYHRGDLHHRNMRSDSKKACITNTFMKLRNAVIIIDEAHVASNESMTLDKLFALICRDAVMDRDGVAEDSTAASKKCLSELCRRNISIVMFTATPNLLQKDIQTQRWSCGTPSFLNHIMRAGDHYTSVFDLLDTGKVFEYENLAEEDPEGDDQQAQEPVQGGAIGQSVSLSLRNTKPKPKQGLHAVQRLKAFINDQYDEPRYHIIRTPYMGKQSLVVSRFQEVFGASCQYRVLDSETNRGRGGHRGEGLHEAFTSILNTEPTAHTFIFIKEGLRCAVTLQPKCRIGVLYERKRKRGHAYDDVIVQGLAGRATGYDADPKTVVFTHLESIERYREFVRTGYKDCGIIRYNHSKPRSVETEVHTNMHKPSWER
jgi:hypothetical protein